MDQTLDTKENESVKHGEERNFEAEASKMGWVPQEKFRGDPQRWVDAKTFVARGEEVLPIVKAQLRETRAELDEVKKAAVEWQKLNEAATERQVGEWKAKYEEAIRTKKEAIAEGDGDKFTAAEATQRELEATRPQPKTEAKQVDPEFKSWLDENPWYATDRTKRLKADLIGADLLQDGLRGRALYDAVATRMQDEERASTGTQRTGAQRGGRTAAATKGGRTYQNLKPEFREQCDRSFKAFGGKGKPEQWQESWLSKATEDMFQG